MDSEAWGRKESDTTEATEQARIMTHGRKSQEDVLIKGFYCGYKSAAFDCQLFFFPPSSKDKKQDFKNKIFCQRVVPAAAR